MKLQRAFPTTDVVSGVTQVDTSVLPWPGYTFGNTAASSPNHVEQSYDALASALGMHRASILTVTQVHGDAIVVVGSERPEVGIEADAMMTNHPTWVLGVKLADCCGVLLYDPIHHAVAAVHSGWRGTALGVVSATVEQMQTKYGTRANDLRAWLSPCASGVRYEVGEDVYAVLSPFCTPVEGKQSRWTFDNHKAITDQLLHAGVPAASIIVDEACSIADTRWHSHRRDGQRAGRMLAFIGLRPMAGK